MLKRAAELLLANVELEFQNGEKGKRAAELVIANHELQKAKEQFRLVVESAPNAMVLVDSQGLIVLVNAQTERLFGYGRDELVGNKMEMLMPPEARGRHPGLREHFFQDLKTRSMGAGLELLGRRKDGSDVQIEIGLNPIESAEDIVVLASIVDITERKLQEANLEKHNKELEQIVYVASHDLQEPLRTVSNYMQVFEEDYGHVLDETAHQYLRSVNNATKRMGILIKSLLEFSRLGNDRVTTRVDFTRLIAEVTSDLQTMLTTASAHVTVGPMPTLDVHEINLRQVFQNLISNAIKFRKKDTAPVLRIHAERHPHHWQLSVSDNGIGIAEAHFARVFDIYQRLHTIEEYEGYGIGLANCKKIIQLHGGKIWLESALGIGTTVHFTMPVVQS